MMQFALVFSMLDFDSHLDALQLFFMHQLNE